MKIQIARIAPNAVPSNDVSMLTPEAILATWNLPTDAVVVSVNPVYVGQGSKVEASYDVTIQSDSYPDVDTPPFFTPDIDAAKCAAYRVEQDWE